MIKVTKEMIENGRCISGGFTARQLEALGLNRARGWKDRLNKIEYISEEQYKKFLALKRTFRQPKKDNKQNVSFKHKDRYNRYINGRKWHEKKVELFFLRGRKCERCSSMQNIQVHHKTYDNLFNEKLCDLEILCGNCHKSEHGIS